jgi:hypothetical protein
VVVGGKVVGVTVVGWLGESLPQDAKRKAETTKKDDEMRIWARRTFMRAASGNGYFTSPELPTATVNIQRPLATRRDAAAPEATPRGRSRSLRAL